MVYPVSFASFVGTACHLIHFLFAVHFFLEAVSPRSLLYPNFVPRSHILPNSSQKLILPFHFFSCTLTTLYHVLWAPATWCANFRPMRQASRGLRSAFIKLHNKVSLLVFLPFSLQFSPPYSFPLLSPAPWSFYYSMSKLRCLQSARMQ